MISFDIEQMSLELMKETRFFHLKRISLFSMFNLFGDRTLFISIVIFISRIEGLIFFCRL
jgi:hypothetical protein